MAKIERTFCYRCATKLEWQSERSWYCPTCDYVQYDNPRPTVEVALFNAKSQLLISKRALPPGKGKYDLPGGFCEIGENLETGVYRELEEETGFKQNDIADLKYLLSFSNEYEWLPETYNLVCIVYSARLKTNKEPQAADDSEELIWISKNEVDDIDWSLEIIKQNVVDIFKTQV